MAMDTTAYDDILRQATDAQVEGTGLTPDQLFALAKAIVAHESGFIPTAYHFDGPDRVLDASYGLMQVEGRTAQAYGRSAGAALYDPVTNVRLGAQVLADNLRRTQGNVDAAVSAYNGGFRPALGYGSVLPNGSYGNQAYVNDVMRRWADYLAAAGDTTAATVRQPASGLSGSWWLWLALILGGTLTMWQLSRRGG